MPGGSITISNREARPVVFNEATRQAQQGHLNCTIKGTLTPSASSTVFKAQTCATTSAILACPLTADAATAQVAGLWFTPASGQFTVHHASNAAVDQTFTFVIIG